MTQEQIIAYVDGELGPIEALRFERVMEADPAVAAEVQRHRRVREAVAGHFAPVVGEPLPERLTRLLDKGGNVIVFPDTRWTSRWFGQGGRYAALAATLVVGLMLGQLLPGRTPGPIEARGGTIVARGELARALDGQLASAAQGDAYRIGVSFRDHGNRYCRTFSGAGGAGIGCHGDRGWALERFVAGGSADQGGVYRQAGSSSAEILAAAQEMMAGAPLDAAQEEQAKAAGWSAKPE